MFYDEQFYRMALAGYEAKLQEIDNQIATLRLSGRQGKPKSPSKFERYFSPEVPGKKVPGKRNMSAAGRAAIAAAQKARWTAFRRQQKLSAGRIKRSK